MAGGANTNEELDWLRDEWLGHGMSTEPADRDRAVLASWESIELAGAKRLSQVAIWVDSPLAGVLAAAHVCFAFGDALAQRAITPVTAALSVNVAAAHQVQRAVDKPLRRASKAIHKQLAREIEARGPDFERLRERMGNYSWYQVWEEIGDPVYSQGWEQQSRRSGGLFEENLPKWPEALLEGQFAAGAAAGLDALTLLTDLDAAPFIGIQRAARSCGWMWLWKSCAVLCERPAVFEVTGSKVHLEFRDGWTVSA